jgi:glutathione S-transferase
MNEPLRMYTFAGANGLPTTGPFSLKLAMALRMANVPFEIHVETDLKKSPKRKIPWIERGDIKMADSALILSSLGIDLERGLTKRQRAEGLALRALVEEHWHQVFEYELIVDPIGLAWMMERVPPAARDAVSAGLLTHFEHHLYERGIARHTRDEITAFGKADLDAVAAWVDGREWSVSNEPTLTDASLFGLLAPPVYLPIATPAFSYAKTLKPITTFVERCRARYFPECPPPGGAIA